ncbi:DUF72 domain-containing protein [Halochromatium salexigens]|uniref:DUF72 domain-containing protein n=1 Tax=Halochromatium salexigens TaxID=49447 RepID=A0AAJ0UI97_HALSE|nr:DUF72 domain-containing protein [Halochromatium salexigens]MBK5932005.1 hypothetical protein [Halochromatium salexigens]
MRQLSLLDGLDLVDAPNPPDAPDGRDLIEQAANAAQNDERGVLAKVDRDPPPTDHEKPPTIPAATPTAEVQDLATALADTLNNGLYLGTSSWSFPGWSGLIYGAPTGKANLSRQGLPAYAQHPLLRSVGIDSGFYAPLDATRLRHWAEQVPAQFRFVVKAPALITDRYRRAARGRPIGPNPGFLDPEQATEVAVQPYQEALGSKAGVLLWQFPPMAGSDRIAPRRFAEALYRFLIRLPKGPVYAVELRDAALLTPDLAAALHHGGAVPGLALHPRLPPLTQQLELFSGSADDGPIVIRWLLRRNHRYAEARTHYAPFDRLCEPDPESRAQVARAVLKARAQRRSTFVIVNNKAEGSAPLTLVELARRLHQ